MYSSAIFLFKFSLSNFSQVFHDKYLPLINVRILTHSNVTNFKGGGL